MPSLAVKAAGAALRAAAMWLNLWSCTAAFHWAEARGWSRGAMLVVLPSLLTTASYWVFSAATAYVDVTGTPAWLFRRKIQPKVRISASEQVGVALYVLALQVVVGLPAMAVAAPYFPDWAGRPVPALPTVAWQLVVCIAVEEVLFGLTHRALHTKALYGRFHKRHHSLTAPSGGAAEYAHPLEFLFGNLVPTVLGPMLVGAHPAVYYTWLQIVIQTTCNAHCGFYHPLSPWGDARRHDFHHRTSNGALSPMGIMDRLMGTEQPYTDWLAEQERAEAAAKAA